MPYKILIIRFSSIGDIVLTSPVVRCLKTQINCKIHYFTKKQFKPLIAESPYIDKIYLLETKLQSIIKQLKLEDYDYIIDLHHNLRSMQVKLALRVKSFSFNKLNFKKWLYVHKLPVKMPELHIVDRYLATVKHFNIKNDNKGLDFFINNAEELPAEVKHLNKYVVVAVGAMHFTKQIPIKTITDICNGAKEYERIVNHLPLSVFSTYTDLSFVLIGGSGDKQRADEILLKVKDKQKIVNLVGKLSINLSARLIDGAAFVVTGDTGMMHIAAARKRFIVSYWGNTVVEFGMYPYYPENKIGTQWVAVENKNLSCRPCSKIGYKSCPKGHLKCMKENEFYRYS